MKSTRTHVALLRGINVGGHNKVAMADLRAVASSIGHTEVATYVQSGNVVFAAADPDADATALAQALETAIAKRLAVRPEVIVVSADDLRGVVAENPFADEPNPKAVHAVFFGDAPSSSEVGAVRAAVERAEAKGSRDEARVVGRVLYLWTPDGMGRSKLAAELSRRRRQDAPAPAGTARNWATVMALVDLLDG